MILWPATLVIIAYFASVSMIFGDPLIKLSSGIHPEGINKIFAESSTNTIYDIAFPDVSDHLLEQHQCQGRYCSLNRHVHSILQDTFTILNKTLPSVDDLPPQTKQRRALNFIADAAHWCCGYATDEMVENVHNQEKDLEKVIGKLSNQLIDEHKAAVKSRTILNKYSAELDRIVAKQFNNTNNNLNQVEITLNQFRQSYYNTQNAISLITKAQHRLTVAQLYSRALQVCRMNQIPHELIAPKDLREDLEKLEKSLVKHNKTLALGLQNIHSYYLLKTTTCYYSPTKLVIRVQIPIITRNTRYQLVSLTPIPYRYKGTLCHAAITAEYALLKNNKEVFPLTGTIKEHCLQSHNQLCFVPKYHTSPTADSRCLEAALIRHQPIANLSSACPLICKVTDVTQERIIQFSESRFGVLNVQGEVTLKCPNSSMTYVVTRPFGLLEVSLRCSCNLSTPRSFIERDFPCEETNEEPKVVHTILAAWSRNLENTVLNQDSLYSNFTKIYNPDWTKTLPSLDLSSPSEPDQYELPLHINAGSKLSFVTTIVIIIIIVVLFVAFKKLDSLSPTAIMGSVLAAITPRVRANDVSQDTYLVCEILELLLMTTIIGILVSIYYTLKRSTTLKFFDTVSWDKAKARVTLHDINSTPTMTIQQSMQKKRDGA